MPEGVAMGEEAEQLAREMYQFCVSSDIDIPLSHSAYRTLKKSSLYYRLTIF